ncbi:hypothetical protein [Halomonas sp. C05BenzN]|uniref:hypothetical protein n=1 Tax=Halomonas sp. C05BenzN TaxID=3411041 RepID=UPI003B94E731
MKRLLIVLSLLVVSPLSPGASPGLWITGDIRGSLLPCFQCPETSEPGLARQSGVMQEVAADGVWLDAGGFLDGGEVDVLGIGESLALAEELGMQALHLTWRDVGPALLEALSEASPLLVSASLLDAQGEPLVPPSLVVEQEGQRIGIIGISGVPPGYRDLPAWQAFDGTFRLREAGEALDAALEGLPGDLDRVLVLYAGDHGILRRLIDRAGERVDAFVMGSSFGSLYSAPPGAVVDARSQRGRRLTRLALSDLTPTYHEVTLSSPLSEPAVQALEGAGLRHAPPDREALPSMTLSEASDLSPPFRAPLLVEQHNRVMGLSVLGLETRSEWQGDSEAEGEAYLVLDLLFENRKPFDLIQQDGGQRALRVGNLEQNLVLVVGEKTHAVINEPLRGDDLLPDTFVLPRPGEVRRGKVVYRLADAPPGPLSLRFYHIEYPVLAMALQEGDQAAAGKPQVDDLQHHQFLELGVGGLEEVDAERLGRPADGQRFVAVDLLGRSRLTRTNPANHHDADADPEARVETPRVVPYLYADQHIQLVSQEGYVYLPDWELSELERIPTFLPDRLTGGRLIFALPEAVDTYRVSLYFPNFGTVTEGTQGFPDPMFFGDDAEAFAYRERDTLLDFGLEQLRVRLTELERTDQGLEVEVEVFNETDGPGFWPMETRLGITPAGSGRRITPTAMTDPHGTELPWNAHLPPGEPRRMRLHFPLGAPSGEGAIDVRGLTANPSRPIRWDEHQAVAE